MRYQYPEAKMLTDVQWLADPRNAEKVRIVDMRSADAYKTGHIPGAVLLDAGALRNSDDRFTYLPRPDMFAKTMEAAGIGNDTHVVAYCDEGGRHAARIWYLLNAFGHKKVTLLNGGWATWQAMKLPVTDLVPKVEGSRFRTREVKDMTCPLPMLTQRKSNVIVLDTRTTAEYTGATPGGGSKKAGRVPGAVHVDWKENVQLPGYTFKPAAELLKLYADKGVTPDKEIVTYCASGGRASQSLFTLKLLGYKKVRVYYGSWQDYSSLPDAPVEKG